MKDEHDKLGLERDGHIEPIPTTGRPVVYCALADAWVFVVDGRCEYCGEPVKVVW